MAFLAFLIAWTIVGGITVVSYQGRYSTLEQAIQYELWGLSNKRVAFWVFIHGPATWICALFLLAVCYAGAFVKYIKERIGI